MYQNPPKDVLATPWSRLQRVLATVGSSIVVIVLALLMYVGLDRQEASHALVARSHAVAETLERVIQRLVDAETGQRGYLLTDNARYLEPYVEAEQDVDSSLEQLRVLTEEDPAGRARVDTLATLAHAKFTEMNTVLTLQRTEGAEAALARIESDSGRRLMQAARLIVAEMERTEAALLRERRASEALYTGRIRWTLVGGTLAAVAIALLINTILARHAAEQAHAARELDARNARLHEQALELELQNQQLQEQAVEMETQQQHLQEQAAALEHHTEELQSANAELEKATEALRHGEERLLLALDAGRLGTWEWDIATNVVLWAAATEKMHGLEPGTFPGTFEAYQSDIHPDDRASVVASIQAAVENRTGHHLVYRIIRPDGEVRWLEAHGRLMVDRAGRPVRLVGVCNDVTERRRAEEAPRLLAAASEELASSLDYETTIASAARLVVPALADWCVVDIADERGGGALKRLVVHHQDPEKLSLADELARRVPDDPSARSGPYNVLRTGRSEFMADVPDRLLVASARDAEHLRLLRALGFRSYMSVPLAARGTVFGVITLLAAESGRHYSPSDVLLAEDLARRVAMAIDNARLVRELSESRDQLEQQAMELEMTNEELQTVSDSLLAVNDDLHSTNLELERAVADREAERVAADVARRQAELANQAKSQFLATMSHELRTPLNAITGYVELMEMEIRGPVTAEQREDLDRIRRSGRHLLGLINDILNFARLESGQVEFNVAEVNVQEILSGVELLIAPQVAVRGLEYVCTPCDPSLVVCADAEKLQQVLLNLLTNAIKFTDPHGRVSVSCDSDPLAVRIHVSDTGRGIAPDKLERVFEPFIQVDRHLTQASQQGVGLGLAISRDLARRMGGDLSAVSSIAEGSVFTVSLPRARSGRIQRARAEGGITAAMDDRETVH